MYINRREEVCWRIAAASVRGTSHEKMGQPCQDAHYWYVLPEGILVAVTADGAGSASLGGMGAEVAARIAVETIVQHKDTLPAIDDDGWLLLLTEALKAAQTAIYTEAVCHEVSERELATTLILMVAAPAFVAVAQIGDGASVVGDIEGNILGLTRPQTGEYINQTTFLISPHALDTAQLVLWRGEAAHIAILSDGLQMIALSMPEGSPYVPFFSPLFRFMGKVADETAAAHQLEAFLCSPRVRERADDDLTLLLATLVG